MITGRIKHLEKEHVRLEKEIESLERTGKFTDNQLHNLKKEKLYIKDELSKLYKRQYEEREYLDIEDDRR